MNKEIIENIWNKIIPSGEGEFEYKLLSKESIPQLNIGFNKKSQRCLILELPLDYDKPFQQFEKENLSLKYFKKEKCLCIILNDDFFKDLFDDLILSIYSKIYNIYNTEEYSELFTRHFFKWSAFFENKKTDGLTREQVKGLIGELFYLKNLLLTSKIDVDDVLISWRGPYDEGHDFVFEFTDYEIKTIESSKNNVRISSEFQLQSEKGKELELVVIFVNPDNENGLSLKLLINEVKTIVLDKLGDNSIFINTLAQKGLTIGDLDQYEVYRYTPIEEISYDSTKENFPKLIRSTIPEEVYKLNYSIRLNLIEKFIINKKQF
ncbi:PD-(D/E)XK motif protein [Flavobacterium solisilvae]|uniref:PD-(D/E)XK motif protein n=1 Tax=Flavobacterium solisilvae TaxID=1852019 RepID=A0ABX1QRG8_9FLAO|nr:PD-(D/E)XK motif protein [Flavobacterium solisilvae]NMH24802.1 PD-(D/E)XK motif protein [Flavobacterium solisilvae]